MTRRGMCVTLGCMLAWAVLPSPARAVIRLDITVAKIYETSKLVLVGTVAELRPDARVVDIKVRDVLKGESPGQRLRVQIAAPAELMQSVSVGQPAILFVGRAAQGVAAVHLADTWLLANAIPGTNMQAWRVVQVYDAVKKSFPGRTVALDRLVLGLKAGQRPIIDRWDRKPFAGGLRKRAKLDVTKPTWILAADFNADKRPDLLVGTADATRLFLATSSGYEDATAQWGPLPAAGYHAAGDVDGDGRVDLLLDETLYLNDGRKLRPLAGGASFKLALPLGLADKTQPLTAALVDVTGDKRPDAVLLSADGRLRVFENPGSADQPWSARPAATLFKPSEAPIAAAVGDWGDTGKPHALVAFPSEIVRYALDAEGGPPGDLQRLTGVDLRKSDRYREGLNCRFAAMLDMDGDGRPDLFAVCARGNLLMVNRGLGTFLLDENAGGPIGAGGTGAFKPSRGLPWTAADLEGHGCDDLVVLGEDGTLYEVDNGGR